MTEIDHILERLSGLHPKLIDLSLDRMVALLARLGNPQRALPPVVHVAGTNGKGSTIAFLRAMLEAAGYRVHVYTSPHLLRFNERIRLAGQLVDDARLQDCLIEIERMNDGAPITQFEITTAAAFVLFARIPADIVLLETGLGGRLDATNVVAAPMATAITRISFDHREFLGDTIEKIAGEKAGIMKPNVPCIIGPQGDDTVHAVFRQQAASVGARLDAHDTNWVIQKQFDGFVVDADGIQTAYPVPSLVGTHQMDNAATALRVLDALHGFAVPYAARCAGLTRAEWPGRIQQMPAGHIFLHDKPHGSELWVDGAHNDSGAMMLAAQCAAWRANDIKKNGTAMPLVLVVAMLKTKNPVEFMAPFAGIVGGVVCRDMPGQPNAYSAQELADLIRPHIDVPVSRADDDAVYTSPTRFVVAGSLYALSAWL